MAHKPPKLEPRWPTDLPTWSQDGPKTPTWSQDAPKTLNFKDFGANLEPPDPPKTLKKTMEIIYFSQFFAMFAKCNFRANLTPNLEPRRLNLEPRPPNLETKWTPDFSKNLKKQMVF